MSEEAKPEVPLTTKLSALDALDRLAMNPSHWFPDSVLNALTQSRIAIITERWADAIRVLEDAKNSVLEFVKMLKNAPDAPSVGVGESRAAAVRRAEDELQQLVYVLAWLDKRPEQ
jgi:hypothetical protein